jgi:hypothetical protein
MIILCSLSLLISYLPHAYLSIKSSPLYRSLFSCLYALILSAIPNTDFADFDFYLAYARDSSVALGDLFSTGFLPFLANEPVWLLINSILSQILDDVSTVRLIIFFSSFILSFTLLGCSSKSNFLFIILLLALPSVVKNYLIHIRQGFASSLFLSGFLAPLHSRRRILCFVSPFIHSSFFIILAVILVSFLSLRIKSQTIYRLIPLMFSLIAVSFTISTFAFLLGARQASSYYGQSFSVSSLGFLVWSFVLYLFLSESPLFIREHWYEISFVVFYLALYWITPFSTRLFEGVLLLPLLASTSLSSTKFFVMYIFTFFVLFLAYWLSLPTNAFLVTR